MAVYYSTDQYTAAQEAYSPYQYFLRELHAKSGVAIWKVKMWNVEINLSGGSQEYSDVEIVI